MQAVTLIFETHAPQEVYEHARAQFTEIELVNLTLAIVAINAWNRIAISFRTVPGTCRPVAKKHTSMGEVSRKPRTNPRNVYSLRASNRPADFRVNLGMSHMGMVCFESRQEVNRKR
jgi:hypothetical protein